MIHKDEQFGKGWLPEKPSVKDYRAEELMTAFPPVTWVEKPVDKWKRYLPIRNQAQSSACVSFTLAVLLGIENLLEEGKFVILSPRTIYARGYVAPGGGMYYSEAIKIGNETGATLESLLPSDGKDESGMRDLSDEKPSDRIVAKTYRGGAFVFLPVDIDAIASIIQSGRAVAMGTRFNTGGFSTGEVILKPNGTYGHAVAGVDFTIWKGEKAIIFQNSWGDGWGFGGLGVITESQMKSGGFVTGIYYQNLTNQEATGTKPKIKILVNSLKPGQKNSEVSKLQIMLQYLGHFPSDVTLTTGYYGGISRQAVKDYQTKHFPEATGIADKATIDSLNAKFS